MKGFLDFLSKPKVSKRTQGKQTSSGRRTQHRGCLATSGNPGFALSLRFIICKMETLGGNAWRASQGKRIRKDPRIM